MGNQKFRFSIRVLVFILIIACGLYVFMHSAEDEKKNGLNFLDTSFDTNNVEGISMQQPDKDNPTIITHQKEVTVFAYQGLSESVIKKIKDISWKSDCPVSLKDLRYVQVAYLGFDNKPHDGELIVHKSVAEDVVEIFKELYEAGFRIEKIRLIDEYAADDNKSMEDNNTSAFCYREIAGKKGKLSKHSYGIAIDINPVQNPYIVNKRVLPETGNDFVDREDIRNGMIIKGDACYNAFIKRGWTWGGDWKTEKDYQHFQKNIE